MKSFLKLAAAPAAIGFALVSMPAFAQVAAAEEDSGETIIVTGSRIASPTIQSPAPLQIVDAAAIDDSGVTNVQELLLENPVFGTPGLSRTNSAFLTSGTGVATIDLRNLGSDRTLVLINGRRVVASLAGSATVDLNVIPTQFIERIDILTGGASSLYGSDAVAGVVNFVFKNNFEGIEANAQYGITSRGDESRYQFNVTTGTNFAEDRGNIMVHFGYSNEEGLYSRERSNTQVDDISLMALTGDPADFATSRSPFFSSFVPQGRFITAGGTFTYSPTGVLQPCFTSNNPTCGGGAGVGPNGFNRQQFRTLAVPVERYLFAASGNYEISDAVNFFFEGTFNKTSASRNIEPFPLESGGSNGIFPDGGGFNVENYLPGTSTIVANPFVPAAILAAAADTNGDGLRNIGFARRLSEFGPRSGSTERDFYRFVVGLSGDLMDSRFRWDVSYNYGQVSENQVSSGQVNVVNFRDALAVMTDVNDLDLDGSTTDAICMSSNARANGCQPANIFGLGSISQGAVNYIQAQGTFQTGIKQHVVQGNISGTLFELPAGPLGVAVGYEYRKESSFSDNDALTNQGLNAGNVLPDTRGSFDVKEAFVEVKIPILADTPFFNLLEIGGAFRISDYSTVGSVKSWNVTGTWKPIEDVRIRGTWARAVRAPNVGELFSGLSQTFPPGLIDPCLGVAATGGGATGDNCRAAPGVLANIAANTGVGTNPATGALYTNSFFLNQADLQGISGFDGGNPNLFQETADSWTVGAVVTPRSLGGALSRLTLTADYYNIKIEDVIGGFPRPFTLTQCYGAGNQTFCDLITRRPNATAINSAGSIDLINALSVNASVLKTAGIDVTAAWNTPLGLMASDRLSFRFAYTHILKYDFFSLPNEAPDPSDGEIGTARDRFTANLGYDTGKFKIGFTGTYIGKSYEDDAFCVAFGLEPKCISVPAKFYLDMNAGFNVSDELEVYFGIDNLLDTKAPNLLSGTSFNVTGSDTAADVYDIFGRRYFAGARLRF